MTLRYVVLFLFLFCSAAHSWAGIISAASCSQTDVLNAYNAAVEGDTIKVPAGKCTWSAGITITKSVILQGAGTGSTVITSNTDAPLITITPAKDASLTRVTGIEFQLGTARKNAIKIIGRPKTPFIPKKIRIDHNKITGGRDGIHTYEQAYGVIDNNVFIDVHRGILGDGAHDQTQIWSDFYNAGGITAGTGNAMFVEDNSFTYTYAGSGTGIDASIYLQMGALYVCRYNYFDASALTNGSYVVQLLYNHHGNQQYGSTGYRGIPIFESYNNTGVCAPHSNCEFMSIRGGSALIHDENFTIAPGKIPRAVIVFTEEEGWQTAFFSTLRQSWPAQDQVFNSFVWNVKLNGAAIADVKTNSHASDAIFIKKDRDYFMRAPASTGGKETFTGTRYGGSTTPPTTSDTGSMVFSGSGANAYYPYTPYAYPHPLRGGAASTTTTAGRPPQPPSNLRKVD